MAATRTFQDHDLRTWEVYPSAGRHGSSDRPHVVFHCLTERGTRPRHMMLGINEADAERRIADLSAAELVSLLERASEIP